MTLTAMFASVFNVESTYVAQSTLPYVTSVISDSSLYPIIAIIFQAIYGLMMLIAPTSVILLITLEITEVSYKDWIKYIWKLFLTLFVISFIVFIVVFLI